MDPYNDNTSLKKALSSNIVDEVELDKNQSSPDRISCKFILFYRLNRKIQNIIYSDA